MKTRAITLCPDYHCGCDRCRDLRAWADQYHTLDMRSVEPYKRPFILAAREERQVVRSPSGGTVSGFKHDYDPEETSPWHENAVRELEDTR